MLSFFLFFRISLLLDLAFISEGGRKWLFSLNVLKSCSLCLRMCLRLFSCFVCFHFSYWLGLFALVAHFDCFALNSPICSVLIFLLERVDPLFGL